MQFFLGSLTLFYQVSKEKNHFNVVLTGNLNVKEQKNIYFETK